MYEIQVARVRLSNLKFQIFKHLPNINLSLSFYEFLCITQGSMAGYCVALLLNCMTAGYCVALLLNCRTVSYCVALLLNCRTAGYCVALLLNCRTRKFFYSKSKKMHGCIKFILFWDDTLDVSDCLSAHHQKFETVHTATGICLTAVYILELLMTDGKTVRNM